MGVLSTCFKRVSNSASLADICSTKLVICCVCFSSCLLLLLFTCSGDGESNMRPVVEVDVATFSISGIGSSGASSKGNSWYESSTSDASSARSGIVSS